MGSPKWAGADYESPESQRYVGMKRSEVLNSVEDAGIPIRVLEGGNMITLTADYRPQRLNILVVDGIVTKAAFF
jgi:hypothetical protein